MVDGEGAPAASAQVEIAGQLILTDALGQFTAHHVPDKYSAVIVYVPPPVAAPFPIQKAVEIYDELHTRSPQFRLLTLPPVPAHQGSIGGTVSGGTGFPMPIGPEYRFGATATNSVRGFPQSTTLLFPTTYAFPVLLWGAPPANKYTVGGLQWLAGQGGLPVRYDGWVSHEVVLPLEPYPEATLDLVLAPVEARTVTGSITKPAGCTPSVQGNVEGIVLFNDVPATSSYSYLLPKSLSGATVSLTASCSSGSQPNRTGSSVSVGLNAENSVDLSIPAPPSLIQPSHQATGVTYATPFAWAAGDHLLRTVLFEGTGWTIYRHGTGESSALPDLTRFGISLPKGSSVRWQVLSVKVDSGAATTWDDILGTSKYDRVSTGHSIFSGDSQEWTFTLEP